MIHGRTFLLSALVIVGLASPGRSQDVVVTPQPGSNPPGAFINGPGPAAPPEFCPPNKKPLRLVAFPFQEDEDQKFCPTTNAFGDFCEKRVSDALPPTCYFGIGLMALRRTDLARGDVASIPPPLGFTFSTFIDYQSVPSNFDYGIRGEIGYFFGPGAVEFSGFYVFRNPGLSTTVANNANIFVFFNNFAPPAGFSPALWSNVSVLNIGYSFSMGNMELNYRCPIVAGTELLGGIRYVDLNERIFIDTRSAAGTTSYDFQVHDRFIGAQLGFESEWVLIPRFSLSFLTKGAVGPNFVNILHTLSQGNGVQGPGSSTNVTQTTGLVELGFFAHMWFNDRCKLRVGYEAMWLLHLPEAQQQISFNTNLSAGNPSYNDNIFFHGPIFELQFAF